MAEVGASPPRTGSLPHLLFVSRALRTATVLRVTRAFVGKFTIAVSEALSRGERVYVWLCKCVHLLMWV